MPNTPRILAFAGSARRESLNKKLLAAAVKETRDAGGDVTLIDLNDYPLPLYHGDDEAEHGQPENALKLVELVRGHQALLVASPEYNSLITPLLKNTIDWCSRSEPNPFAGKIAAVISASPGAYGGVRSAAVARQLLNKLGCFVAPSQVSISKAHEAFDEAGALKQAHSAKSVREMAVELVTMTAKLTAS